MKKLGLIGGTGPESTIEYYRQIEYGVQKQTGAFPELVIESLSSLEVLNFCAHQQYDDLVEYLLKGLQTLKNAGADHACLTAITPHIVFEKLAKRTPLPLFSILDTACAYAQKKNYRKLALLGTYPTMTGSFFQKPFLAQGIEVVTPTEVEMQYIGERIEKELELGKVIPETQQKFCEIANRLVKEENVDAIVLGCTELPLVLNDNLTLAPCMDVMNIHIEKLIAELVKG